MSAGQASFSRLARLLGHDFADPSLLTAALTHGGAAYQRLEFLGDRVLALVVAGMLYRRFPAASEGELAPRFNSLVRRETLAEVAREMGLGPYLILDAGERQGGGRDKDAILADALEALLAALYLDGGFDAARTLVERLWEERLAAQREAPRDPKSALQEWSQGRGLGLPVYTELARSGPAHAPHWVVEARVASLDPARGEGASKREAERNAAAALLAREAAPADG